jgi:Lanthionine synthetase C-like protein
MVDGQFGFPYSVGESIPARLGWCYGMPSSATCFAWLAKLDQQFIPDVIDCGQDADAIRASEFHGITDACICHGEAGWAYIGARLVESLGQAVPPGFTFLTAQASFNLIAARTKDKESGTILHHVNAGTQVMDTVLEGAAGVWLAIAGLQDARCRKWEGMMLLDFPLIDGHE